MLKARVITGLDIGTNTIKCLQFRNAPKGLHLLDYFIEEIPQDPGLDVEANLEITISTLKTLIGKKSSLKNSLVVTAIPRYASILKFIILPSQDKEEIKKMLPFEMEKYIPLSLDKVALDWQIINSVQIEGQPPSSLVMIVVVKKEIIEHQLSLLKKVGLKTKVIDLTSLALYNTFLYTRDQEKGTVVLMDVGAQTTEIDIIDEGILQFTRSAPIGGTTLNQMLQKELGLDAQYIEQLKKEGKIFEDPKSEAIGETWGKYLLREINQSFETYRTEQQKKKIEKIFLSGGGSKLTDFDNYLQRKLNIPVEHFNCLEKLTDIPDEYKQNLGHLFPVAMGLALRGARKSTLQIDLVPHEIETQKIRKRKKTILATLGAALLGMVLFYCFWLYSSIVDKKNQIKALSQEFAKIKNDVEQARETQKKLQLFRDVSGDNELGLDILRQLSLTIPSNIYLDHFIFAKEGLVEIKGKTDSHSAVANLAILLEKNDYLEKVVHKGSREIKWGNITLIEFEIEGIITRGKS